MSLEYSRVLGYILVELSKCNYLYFFFAGFELRGGRCQHMEKKIQDFADSSTTSSDTP